MICPKCDGVGKGVSEKTGKPVKCKGSCGPTKDNEEIPVGMILRSYTRTTTYIDVLDDKSNLEQWQMRMVLIGVANEMSLLEDVSGLHEEHKALEARRIWLAGDVSPEADEAREGIAKRSKEIKDELNRRSQIAKEKAGAEDKADKGTELHGYSELVDQGLPLPKGASFGDVIDMDAYRNATRGFRIVHMEKLVVHDEIKVGGTPDRVSEWLGDQPLIAPDGHVFEPGSGELLITDLKTGTTEYGALKMAMQLAIYSRSSLYDKVTGERTPLGNINQKWGVIMNVPAGTGQARLYWADLELGWKAVLVAGAVRELRNAGRKALAPLFVTRIG